MLPLCHRLIAYMCKWGECADSLRHSLHALAIVSAPRCSPPAPHPAPPPTKPICLSKCDFRAPRPTCLPPRPIGPAVRSCVLHNREPRTTGPATPPWNALPLTALPRRSPAPLRHVRGSHCKRLAIFVCSVSMCVCMRMGWEGPCLRATQAEA